MADLGDFNRCDHDLCIFIGAQIRVWEGIGERPLLALGVLLITLGIQLFLMGLLENRLPTAHQAKEMFLCLKRILITRHHQE